MSSSSLQPDTFGSLHRLLQAREAKDPTVTALRETLDRIQPGLQMYLDRAVDLPFTTHKWDHVIKVEYLCVKNVPAALLESLTNTELFVLILSIWLHDAGMVPQNESESSDETRARHATRIADRINGRKLIFLPLTDTAIRSYVADVCRNHCEPSPRTLEEEALFSRGALRLQLIAALLRLSDICEAAYDRIPLDIFHQYDFPEGSQAYWRTHLLIRGIDAKHQDSGSQLRLQASFSCETDKALIQKATECIEEELAILQPVFQDYGWELSPRLRTDLSEQKPDGTVALAVLPSGIYDLLSRHIYGTASVYVRELVQNAIDACTRESTRRGSKGSYAPSISLTEFFRTIDDEEVPVAIVVTDNGTGMHWRDVNEFLLTVGAGICRASEMERRLKDGTDVAMLIAEFGIGFLSCFVVARKIIVATRKDGFNGLVVDIPDLSSGTTIDKNIINIKVWDGARLLPKGSSFAVILNEKGSTIQPDKALSQWYRWPPYDSYFKRIPLDESASVEEVIHDYLAAPDCVPHASERLQISHKPRHAGEVFSVHVLTDEPLPFSGVLHMSSDGRDKSFDVCQQGIFVESCADLVPSYMRFVGGEVNLTEKRLAMTASRSQLIRDTAFEQLRRSIVQRVVLVVGQYVNEHPVLSGGHVQAKLTKVIRLYLNTYVRQHQRDDTGLLAFYDAVAAGIAVGQGGIKDGTSLVQVLLQVEKAETRTVHHQIKEDYYFGHLQTSHIDGYDVILLPKLADKREAVLVQSGHVVFTTNEAHKPDTIGQDFLDSEYLGGPFFANFFRLHGINYHRVAAHEIGAFTESTPGATAPNQVVKAALDKVGVTAMSVDAEIRAVFPVSGPGQLNLGHPGIQSIVGECGSEEDVLRHTVPLTKLLEVYFQVVTMRLPEAIEQMEQLLTMALHKDEW